MIHLPLSLRQAGLVRDALASLNPDDTMTMTARDELLAMLAAHAADAPGCERCGEDATTNVDGEDLCDDCHHEQQ